MEDILSSLNSLIIELKSIYFPEKNAFNDDQVLVQKLCVEVEKALRYGAREKYTFLGVRKDYWNYINECLPNDEAVKFVQSLSEIKTNQGKGRAILRQALMEKTLADTLQRCAINQKVSREYYLVDSVIRNDQHFQSFVHFLYDLNAIDFNLPYKGYDLDRSWPSFLRKSFDDNKEKNVHATEKNRIDEDPLYVVYSLADAIVKSLSGEKEDNMNTLLDDDTNPITLRKIIELLLSASEKVTSFKVNNGKMIDSLKAEILSLKKDTEMSKKDHELKIKQLHNHYLTLQQSGKMDKQTEGLLEKLLETEMMLKNKSTEYETAQKLNSELNLMKEQYEKENISLEKSMEDLLKESEVKDITISNMKKEIESLKSELKKVSSLPLDNVDGEKLEDMGDPANSTSLHDNVEEHSNEMNTFIEDIIAVLAENDEDIEVPSTCDSEDGLLKKVKLKKKSKVKHANELTTNEKEVKAEKEAVLDKLVELKKEIIVSRQEKGDFQKEIISLRGQLHSFTQNLNEVGGKISARQIHRNIETKKVVTNPMEEPKQSSTAVNTDEEEKETNKKLLVDMEEKLSKMTQELDKCNKEIFDITLAKSKLSQAIEEKNEEVLQLSRENEEMKEVINHNSKLNEELSKLHEELESAQHLIKKLSEEMHSLSDVKENEIKTLQFETSSLELKYEEVLKQLEAAASQHKAALSELSTHKENLQQAENKHGEEYLQWSSEKNKIVSEKEELQKQVDKLTDASGITDKELKFLKVEVSKLVKEKEEEDKVKLNLNNRIQNLIEEKKKQELKYREKLNFLENENTEMREHLVNVTKDKHNLWHRKEVLEVELKARNDERWVSDDEVDKCTNCSQTFSMTLRKHHCRLCGHIFCHSCSNQWIRTHHSKKRLRSCNVCADSYKENHRNNVGGVDIVDGPANESMSDRSSVMGTDDFEESTDSGHQAVMKDELITDVFEILDPATVSLSGSFGPNEDITLLATDVIKSPPFIPSVQEAGTEDFEHELFTADIPAGERHFVPVVIGGSQFQLIWEFKSSPKDIGFGIAFKKSEEEDDIQLQTILPLCRYISHKQTIHGKMSISNPGLYYLVFNNTFSRITTKNVSCSIHLVRL